MILLTIFLMSTLRIKYFVLIGFSSQFTKGIFTSRKLMIFFFFKRYSISLFYPDGYTVTKDNLIQKQTI